MLQLKDLDKSIARLDRAIARAADCPGDPLAVHELAYCLRTFARAPLPPVLPDEVTALVLQVVGFARELTPTDALSLNRFREALLDIAAVIAVQPWDRWVAFPPTETGVVCPLHD